MHDVIRRKALLPGRQGNCQCKKILGELYVLRLVTSCLADSLKRKAVNYTRVVFKPMWFCNRTRIKTRLKGIV